MVLAAGAGTRFGPDAGKLLATLRGRPIVAWALSAAIDAGLDAVAVVTGAVDLEEVVADLARNVAVVPNPRWRDGQATSLAAALDWCEASGHQSAVVGLGDQPLVPAAAWRAVAQAAHAPIVTAAYDGRRRPPVRLDRSVWSMLARRGDEGARELMRRRPDLVGEVACDGDPADVDTVGDLADLEASGEPGGEERAWS